MNKIFLVEIFNRLNGGAIVFISQKQFSQVFEPRTGDNFGPCDGLLIVTSQRSQIVRQDLTVRS